MKEPQYGASINALLANFHQIREQKELNTSTVVMNSDRSNDGFDNTVGGSCTSIAYQLSWRELLEFEKYKHLVFLPRMKSNKVLCNDEVEAINKFGKLIRTRCDLPLGHNLANYVDSGKFKLLGFFGESKVQFTYLAMETENFAA